MNAKHKSAQYPLKVEQAPNDGQPKYLVVTNQGNHFATTYDPTAARLIAASPDLLSALENLLSAANNYQDLRDRHGATIFNAHAAIAKAKGE